MARAWRRAVNTPVRALPIGNGNEIFRASMAAAQGALTFVDSRTPPGDGVAPRIDHDIDHDMEAIIIVRDGTYTFALEDLTVEFGPGGFALVPRGTAHAVTNTGTTPGHLLVVMSSGSLQEANVADFGEPVADPTVRMAPPGPPEVGELASVAARRGTGVLSRAVSGCE
jgi:mannose-6-phosphate isomerase-like protein (cupin superfamily)